MRTKAYRRLEEIAETYRDRDPRLTKEQAFVRAMKASPDLVKLHREFIERGQFEALPRDAVAQSKAMTEQPPQSRRAVETLTARMKQLREERGFDHEAAALTAAREFREGKLEPGDGETERAAKEMLKMVGRALAAG